MCDTNRENTPTGIPKKIFLIGSKLEKISFVKYQRAVSMLKGFKVSHFLSQNPHLKLYEKLVC